MGSLILALCSLSLGVYAQNETFSQEWASQKGWEGFAGFGTGWTHNMDGTSYNLLHGRFSFTFWPSAAQNMEGQFTLLTQTPLHEESAYIKYPLTDHDFLQIAELYLRHRPVANWEYTVGMFADTPDEITPHYWPFYSVGTKFFGDLSSVWSFHFAGRADILGTYVYTTASSNSSLVKREHLESALTAKHELTDFLWFQSVFFGSYNWFQDPDGTLASLSLGREEYISINVTNRDQDFRYVTFGTNLDFYLRPYFKFHLQTRAWKNNAADANQFGRIDGGDLTIFLSKWNVKTGYWFFRCGQNALPSITLPSLYYPGFTIHALQSSVAYELSHKEILSLNMQHSSSSPYEQASSDGQNPGSTPVIPQFKLYLEYTAGI